MSGTTTNPPSHSRPRRWKARPAGVRTTPVMMARAVSSILVVNAGSTSLKLSVVQVDEQTVPVRRLEDVDPAGIQAVAHRVVHGGSRFREPAVIDDEVRDEIFALRSLAPLHNAPALAGIATAERALPDVPHVAVFDTAFHAT